MKDSPGNTVPHEGPDGCFDPELENQFNYHAPDTTAVKIHEQINARTKELAYWIKLNLPPGRNRSLAITHLEDVRMRANAAVATKA